MSYSKTWISHYFEMLNTLITNLSQKGFGKEESGSSMQL